VDRNLEKKFSDMIEVSAKGSLILIIGQMGSTLISAIGTILVARMLGAISFGIISIAQLPVNLALLLINASISNGVIKFIAENRHQENDEELRSIIKAGFTLQIILGVIVAMTLYLLSGYLANRVFNNSELEILIKILSISVFATSILNSASSVLIGFELMGRRSILWMIYSLLKSISSPLLVFLGYGVIGVAFGTSVPLLVSGLIGVLFVLLIFRNLPLSNFNRFSENMKRIFHYAYPLFFSNILSGSMTQIFSLILPLYVSAAIMGNYSAATTFTVLITFFMTPINTATFPLLSKLNPEDSVFEFVFQNIIKYESLIIFPIASMIFASSDHLVALFYGESYDSASLFLKIAMIQFFFVGLGSQVSNSLLNSQKQTKTTLYSTLLYTIIGIPVGLLLIPRYGVIGFQATVILVPKIGLLYSLWWINRSYGISIDITSFIKILISSILGGSLCILVIQYLQINPWFELIIGGLLLVIAYLIIIIKTRALTHQNLEDIHKMIARYEVIQPLIAPIFKILYELAK
jgi:O-antigen/teichoic acid export membrane protein